MLYKGGLSHLSIDVVENLVFPDTSCLSFITVKRIFVFLLQFVCKSASKLQRFHVFCLKVPSRSSEGRVQRIMGHFFPELCF